MIKWNKVTEVLPPEGRDFLIWTGYRFLVSDATYYDMKEYRRFMEVVVRGNEWLEDIAKSKGYFQEFGQKYYFDDDKVFWSELPSKPEEK